MFMFLCDLSAPKQVARVCNFIVVYKIRAKYVLPWGMKKKKIDLFSFGILA